MGGRLKFVASATAKPWKTETPKDTEFSKIRWNTKELLNGLETWEIFFGHSINKFFVGFVKTIKNLDDKVIRDNVGTQHHEFIDDGLNVMHELGKVDPYVVIQYKNQEQKSVASSRRKVSKFQMHCCLCLGGQGTSPVWDEKFKFKVELPGGDDQHKLLLKIMDHDNFTNDDYLGLST
ncbi:elicitor-responsive protein 1 [Phtheirospermum japonicum]|uniref:Elicitor-responsive protein 1 n=1 Tax=Phtheirospermum japonicum TaxID=374723 RepID=A0A830CS93_9LAMI|nr:elicitor-responsive protein 1 [Phtheirospermum japonicum]